jgi:hypothetical protein
MPRLPHPVVAQTSQGLYNAVASANLSPQENDLVTQFSFAYQEGTRLRGLPENQAKQDFNNLSDDAKAQLKAIFPNDKYLQPDPGLLGKVAGGIASGFSKVYKAAGSPLLGQFQALEKYQRALYTPLRVGFEVNTLNQPLFSKNTWSDAYKGKDLYNPNDVKMLEEKYGKANAAVAMGVAAGKTPGEIIKDWGKVDNDIAQALANSLDKPEEFSPMLEEVKLARFSPGRSGARMAYDEKHPVLSTLWQSALGKPIEVPGQSPEVKAKNEAWVKSRQSGFVDAIYSVIISPDTYLTAGLSKIPLVGPKLAKAAIARGADEAGMLVAGQGNKGRVLADKVLKAKTPDELNLTVRELFQRPDVRTVWQNDIGPTVKSFTEAGTTAEQSQIFRKFRFDYPEYNDFETFKLLANHKVFDAESAQRFFSDVDNTRYLINGRVDGTTFYRNGVVTARSTRQISSGIARKLDAIFNPTAENMATRNTIEKADAAYKDSWETLVTLGQEADRGINPNIAEFANIDKDISKSRKLAFKLGTLTARSPQGGLILTGDDAVKTVANFRNLARLVVPRDFADAWALNFIQSDESQQIVALRNLYAAYMQKQGLEGLPKGREFMQGVLDKTFNNFSGFNTLTRTEVSRDLADIMSQDALEFEGGNAVLKNRGATHGFQLAGAVAPLPFEEIAKVKAMVGVKDAISGDVKVRNSIPLLFEGFHRSNFMKNITDAWTTLTLMGRTGVRSGIDHASFYLFTAPTDLIKNFIYGEARKEGKVLTAATGSKSAVGTYKRIINKVFLNGGLEERIGREDRIKIIEDLRADMSKKLGYEVSVQQVDNELIRLETGKRAWKLVFDKRTNEDKKYILDLLVHQPDSINSMARAVSSKSSLSGRFDDEYLNLVLPESTITKAHDAMELKLGKKWRALSTRELAIENQKYPALAHFDAWGLRFAYNDFKLAKGKSINPVSAFFMNNGLRDTRDFEVARRMVLKQVGVNFYTKEQEAANLIFKMGETPEALTAAGNATESMKVFDPDLLRRFVNKFGDSVFYRQKGLSDEKIARIYVEGMLADMKLAFHGGRDAYNQELMNLVKERHFDIVEEANKAGKKVPYNSWEKAVASIEFPDFENATVNMHPVGDINVRVDYMGKDIESLYRKFGNAVFEQSDRQVTGMFNQPALVNTYVSLRKAYANQERIFAAQEKARILAENPFNSKAEAIADDLAAKRYTELAHNDALYTVLKYIDNPAIKSNFALSVRHVGRFYRATEDFYRRYYRMMRDKPVQASYRMRLLHQGLQSYGGLYKDQQGNEYFIFPTDAVINGAVEPVVRKLTGDNQYKIPQFDDFKMKLTMLNPSFSPDAGMPTLAGPGAAVSVLALDGILGKTGNAWTANLGQNIKQTVFGNNGKNMGFRSSLMPMFVENAIKLTEPAQNILGINDLDHASANEKSAAMQAISYMQAYGNVVLPENPTPQERNDYMKAVRISTGNILFMRAFLGMFSPAAATEQESKGVPNYYKKAGITGLRNEFYTILDGIKQTYGTDIQDPYALATAIFVANNPKKSIYLASRTDKNTNVLINKTQQVKNWALSNKTFINTYGETAYIFAPQVGEFNPAVYNWLESQDLLAQPDLGTYLERVLVAQDKAAYFNIANKEKEALANTTSISERQAIINNSTVQRQALLNSNPYLVEALQSSNNFPSEKIMLDNLSTLLSDENTPIPDITRVKMRAAVNAVQGFVSLATDQEYKSSPYFTDSKRIRKEEIEKLLNELRTGDLVLSEAYRAVLQPILDFYSRDTYVAFRKANY